jgi:hypothetical protein
VTNPYPADLQALSDRLGGQSRVAALLAVDRSRISRWLKREQPDKANQVKIAGLHYIMTRLLKRFHPETAQKWLEGTNAHLQDQRPIDLIRQNRIAEVAFAIEQTETGAYA